MCAHWIVGNKFVGKRETWNSNGLLDSFEIYTNGEAHLMVGTIEIGSIGQLGWLSQ